MRLIPCYQNETIHEHMLEGQLTKVTNCIFYCCIIQKMSWFLSKICLHFFECLKGSIMFASCGILLKGNIYKKTAVYFFPFPLNSEEIEAKGKGSVDISQWSRPHLIAFSLGGGWLWSADPLLTGRKSRMHSVFTPRHGLRWMRVGLIRRSCMSHFIHTRCKKSAISNTVPLPHFCAHARACTWSRITGQQEVKLLPVSSLLLQPCFQHHLNVRNTVLDPLQINFCSKRETVWWKTRIYNYVRSFYDH